VTRVASRTVLRQMLAKARRKLAAARRELKARYFEEATTHAYYAAFHAVTAILATQGLAFSSHAQTIGAFNARFDRAGLFDKEFAKILHRLFGNRQLADYDWMFAGDAKSAREDVQDAAALVARCHGFIRQFGVEQKTVAALRSTKSAPSKVISAKKKSKEGRP